MTTPEEKAQIVAEFSVAKLDVKPGDVVIVRAPADWDVEARGQFAEGLWSWARDVMPDVAWVVLPHGADPSVVHTMTPDEIANAGAGDWPHEGRGGVVAGTKDDSAAESGG